MDTGDTAWILTSATLVLLMTVPGLGLFYGGMVRAKGVLNMMMMTVGAAGVVGLVWVLWGYSEAFGSDTAGGLVGSPFEFLGLKGIGQDSMTGTLPTYVWVAFQATFAVITVALICGAIADRVKFGPWLLFTGVWLTLVYSPMCHMVWGGGFLSGDGPIGKALTAPLDFAGGAVVHINAGVAGLVLALVIGVRHGFAKEPMRPHNLPFVMVGAALLWIGWFGFNAGSAGGANGLAGLAWLNTFVATAVAILAWLATEKIRDGHATSLGGASGAVAGLVAITPAAGFVSPIGAIVMGAAAGVLCAIAVGWKYKLGFDDSLDVVGVHLVGGLLGTILTGLFATETGLFYGHGPKQLIAQILAAVVTIIFSAAVTAVIALAIKATIGWRIGQAEEISGIDLAVHSETAYETISSARVAGRS